MHLEHRDEKPRDEGDVLRHLIDAKRIDGAVKGIVRQVLARGERTLSERQEHVFHTQVREKYLLRVCELCGDLIPVPELMASWDNGSYCASCAAILGKAGGA
ncbi:MAG TPA: hypothetical protein VKA46_05905 [Gemmataceae bacterium]|nr:hypothetical protein [Gemmataceae bacterium]